LLRDFFSSFSLSLPFVGKSILEIERERVRAKEKVSYLKLIAFRYPAVLLSFLLHHRLNSWASLYLFFTSSSRRQHGRNQIQMIDMTNSMKKVPFDPWWNWKQAKCADMNEKLLKCFMSHFDELKWYKRISLPFDFSF
jgi:hypothetical protein